jgi:protein N-terminal amidase
MKIACLQFAPNVADVENNLSKADEILNQVDAEDLQVDLLVLPELAFTGTPISCSMVLSICSVGSSNLQFFLLSRLQLQVSCPYISLSRRMQHGD